MASAVIMTVLSSVISAAAFTGGNALYQMFDKSGAIEESKRHNRAVEKLTAEQETYNIKRAKNQDWLQTEINRKQEASNELSDVNYDFDTYKKLFGSSSLTEKQSGMPHPNLVAPSLDYTPSEQQKKYEKLFVAGGSALGVGGVILTNRI